MGSVNSTTDRKLEEYWKNQVKKEKDTPDAEKALFVNKLTQ